MPMAETFYAFKIREDGEAQRCCFFRVNVVSPKDILILPTNHPQASHTLATCCAGYNCAHKCL